MSATSVYIGFWKNYNVDGVPGLGLTLTIPQAWGAVLIAFIALFVNTAMINLWNIVCFVIHQYRSTPSHPSGLYHQQQAVLCNAPNTATTLITLIKLAWTWRGKSTTAIRSSMPLTLTAVFYLALLSAASLFSSRALLRGDEALLAGENCGLPQDVSDESILLSDIAIMKWVQLTIVQAREYVRNCYAPEGVYNRETCKVYTTPVLPVITNTTAQCPFSSSVCAQPNAIEIDTGYINSNEHFGINTPEEEQLRYRTIVKCSPILAEKDYSTPWFSPELELENTFIAKIPGDKYKLYKLGATNVGNFTWLASNYSMLDTDQLGRAYGLGSVTSYADFHENLTISGFSAIDELLVPNADTSIFYLLNSVSYVNSTEDPWFRATSHIDKAGLGRPETHLYYADGVSSAIACTQQYEYCVGDNCTPRLGVYQLEARSSWLNGLSPKQLAVFELFDAMMNTEIGIIAATLGSRVLQATDLTLSLAGVHLSPGLVSTQWQTEMINIFNIGLASTQRSLADFASTPKFYVPGTQGEGNFGPRNYTVEPEGELLSLCSAIRIRDLRFTNFSVLGLAVILSLGLFIIGFNLAFLPTAAFSLRRKYGMHEHPHQEWREGRLFMMQRSFLEANGIGPWKVDKNGDIPWISEQSSDKNSGEGDSEDGNPKTKKGYHPARVPTG